ncbi:MAG: imidazole glycerol phosphate synthase subunit HisH [Spirochaetota bacterium]
MKIGVVDYSAGNLKSVETALRYLQTELSISADPDELLRADKLIFPGVGEAASAMQSLRKVGLDQAILEFVESGKYFLGLCLGCQIILEKSEEREAGCLGLIRGTVKRFDTYPGLKVPHMGWNQAEVKDNTLFKGIPEGSSFYFVHSYYPSLAHEDEEMCRTEYGIEFSSGLHRDNIFAVQFHPEKSGRYGLKLLENFLAL